MILIHSRHLGFIVSFNRTYDEYKSGFGDFHSEFWLGLDRIHLLTSNTFASFTMRFEGRMTNAFHTTVEYHDVRVGDESTGYALSYARRGTGTRGNGNLPVGVPFQAMGSPTSNGSHPCVASHGGWWYRNKVCLQNDLNFNSDVPIWQNRVPLTEAQIALKPEFG
jgi:hypothetical protein